MTSRFRNIYLVYISRALSQVEQRYRNTEWEALAVRWSCERLRMYLVSARYKIITDHKPLEFIFNNPNSKPPARLKRWCMYLQEFDLTVAYRPDEENPADYTSRHPVYTPKDASDYREQRHTEALVKSIIRRNVPQALSMDEIGETTKKDQTLTMVMDSVQNGGQETRYNREDLKPFKLVQSELSVGIGILLKGSRIVVPKSLQQKVANTSHGGGGGASGHRKDEAAVMFSICQFRLNSVGHVLQGITA